MVNMLNYSDMWTFVKLQVL